MISQNLLLKEIDWASNMFSPDNFSLQFFAMFLGKKTLESYDAKGSSQSYFYTLEDLLDEYITN